MKVDVIIEGFHLSLTNFKMPHKKRARKNHFQVKQILAQSETSFLDKKTFERVPRHDRNPGDHKREQKILNDESDEEVVRPTDKVKVSIETNPIPKKSRRNKYFLVNHPELKDFVKPKLKRPLKEIDDQSTTPIDVPEKKLKIQPPSICDQLQSHMITSRFRYLNEKLYTSTSEEARKLFEKDPQSFYAYHQGYSTSMNRWPDQPLNEIIDYIRKRSTQLVVADLGCGDARLARELKSTHPNIHSFDLMALNDHVQICDIAHTPLKDKSVDIVVFCLSLMGTNLTDFIREAHRILRLRGTMKIVEIASRFDNQPKKFVSKIEAIGFQCSKTNAFDEDPKEKTNKHGKGSKYFFVFDFVKTSETIQSKSTVSLAPCLHKKR